MTELADQIAEYIRTHGPINVAQFMTLALSEKTHGYYRDRDPLGVEGDFTTAPEISQIFGEMIGACLAQTWLEMGAPSPVNLVEFGPGRGTLMADALRATKRISGWHDAIDLHIIETNPRLAEIQSKHLADYRPQFHKTFADVPARPPILGIANEFLDCLPIHQFVRTERGWQERLIALDGDQLTFALDPRTVAIEEGANLPIRSVLETAPARLAAISEVGERLVAQTGACLFIDYGFAGDYAGDTLQAVRRHCKTSPLSHLGDADITSLVDFAALADAAIATSCEVFGPIAQREFLSRLGATQRFDALTRTATPAQRETLASGLARLLDPAQMGERFHVLGIASGTKLAGFPQQPGDKA